MKLVRSLALVSGVLSAALHAQPSTPSPQAANAPSAAATGLLSEGEVRKVDAGQGKITLRHGPLTNLGMPPMTMVFTVTNPGLLQGLKAGDRVRFTADRIDGTFVVTALQPAGAAPAQHMPGADVHGAAAGSALPKVDGVVEQLDAARGFVVIRHGDIPNLGMERMTMGFDVADRKLLEGLKVGQKVTFQADMVGGNATVVGLVPVH